MVVDHPPLVAADDPVYKKRLDDVLVEMGTTLAGLSDRQAVERLGRFGPNKLPDAERRPAWRLLLDQFLEPLILLLLVSAIVSYLVGKTKDAVGIFLATVLNCSLGFRQEIMSRRSVDALKRMSSFTARMLRDDTEEIVEVADIVPGDILLLEEGEKVPADARLIEAYSFQVDESSLTGESLPVAKRADRITDDVPLAERTNMVFLGTHVTRGRAVAVVIGTGTDTEMGRIASIVAEEPGPTPLQVQIADLATKLGAFAVLVCTLFFVLSMMAGHDIVEVFSVSVSLAVAAIPEGLPTVVTVTLALGMRRMAEENAIVKRLPAVETLGCTTVICSDKTGTLTHNKMTVREVFFNGRSYLVTGDGYSHHGDFFFDPDVSAGCHSADAAGEAAAEVNARQAQADPEELFPLAKVAFLCNNAALVDGEAIGDPTEAALKVLGYKAGATDALTKRLKRIDEVPFESDIRHMVTVHQDHDSGATVTFVKGALDVVLDMCDHVYFEGKSRPLGPDQVACIEEVNDAFCEKAMRVLAFAYGDDNRKDDRTGLVFAGLVGMIDPARAEVHDAVAQCRDAGVRVVMITGDHKHTAMAVARELGILEDDGEAYTGSEIDEMDDEAFGEVVMQCNVFSRVTPEHKVRILEALKAKGHIVAMTGDGVNDAPALSKADIGVSMAIIGTDVAKETADMVLADDNFATIVTAVKEGRTIYTNLRKFLRFQLTANVAALTLMFVATAIGMPAPLTPIQILLINIVMDGPPALALGLEPPVRSIMNRPPRDPEERLLSRDIMTDVILYGLVIAGSCLWLFQRYIDAGDLGVARVSVFTLFVLMQLFLAFGCRTHRLSLVHINPLSNPSLIISVLASAAILAVIVFTPVAGMLGTSLLPLADAAKLSLAGVAMLVLTEVRKAYGRMWEEAYD